MLSRGAVPGQSGVSRTNVYRMPAFDLAHPSRDGSSEGVPQPVGQLAEALSAVVVAPTWEQHVALLEKVKEPVPRASYAREAAAHGLSRAVLTAQIHTLLNECAGKAVISPPQTWPPAWSYIAPHSLKGPNIFDFLTRGLVAHLQQFLTEIGVSFAFVGQQVDFTARAQDSYLLLLFCHLKLLCLGVVEHNATAFEPELAGEMNLCLRASRDSLIQRSDAHRSPR